jgi:lipoprotein-anchoring transpeptidase ErfK/SrfK
MTRTLKRGLVLAAVLAPVIPIVIGVSMAEGGGGSQTVTTGGIYRPNAGSPQGVSNQLQPEPAFVTAIPPGPGALVAQVLKPTTMRAKPGGRAIGTLPTQTGFQSPTVVWVERRSGHWLGVVTTQAGNGRLGWIPQSVTRLGRDPWEINVSLGKRRLTVMKLGKVMERYTIAVGAPGSPTPTGNFSITDDLNTGDPTGPYGCCILATSATSPHAIQDWTGGNRIAIHSTPETSSIGLPVSHGCMRLSLPEGRWLLNHIPLGTPTIIRE